MTVNKCPQVEILELKEKVEMLEAEVGRLHRKLEEKEAQLDEVHREFRIVDEACAFWKEQAIELGYDEVGE